jgi:hypothetical protein
MKVVSCQTVITSKIVDVEGFRVDDICNKLRIVNKFFDDCYECDDSVIALW